MLRFFFFYFSSNKHKVIHSIILHRVATSKKSGTICGERRERNVSSLVLTASTNLSQLVDDHRNESSVDHSLDLLLVPSCNVGQEPDGLLRNRPATKRSEPAPQLPQN